MLKVTKQAPKYNATPITKGTIKKNNKIDKNSFIINSFYFQ